MNINETANQYRLLVTRFLDADQAVLEHEEHFNHLWKMCGIQHDDLLRDKKDLATNPPMFKENHVKQFDRLSNQYGRVKQKYWDARKALDEFVIQHNMVHIKKKLK